MAHSRRRGHNVTGWAGGNAPKTRKSAHFRVFGVELLPELLVLGWVRRDFGHFLAELLVLGWIRRDFGHFLAELPVFAGFGEISGIFSPSSGTAPKTRKAG